MCFLVQRLLNQLKANWKFSRENLVYDINQFVINFETKKNKCMAHFLSVKMRQTALQ